MTTATNPERNAMTATRIPAGHVNPGDTITLDGAWNLTDVQVMAVGPAVYFGEISATMLRMECRHVDGWTITRDVHCDTYLTVERT